jgi:hypothetical protein
MGGKQAITTFILDATGLGAPICELVEKVLGPLADIKRVYITGGINTTEGSEYKRISRSERPTYFGIDGRLRFQEHLYDTTVKGDQSNCL